MHSREPGSVSSYAQLEEMGAQIRSQLEPRIYMFYMKVSVDKCKLKDREKVNSIRFFISYDDTLIKDWKEGINQWFGDDFLSQNAILTFNSDNNFSPIKVSIQTIDPNKNIIESIQLEFSLIEAASSNGTLVKPINHSDSSAQICMLEQNFTTKTDKKYYSYKIDLEFNPEHIPWEDLYGVGGSLNYSD